MGRRDRWLHHERKALAGETSLKASVIRKTIRLLGELPKVKVHENLAGDVACSYEVALIAALGRRPYGPLVNHTKGGDGLVDAAPEVYAKMHEATRGKKRPCPPETRAKISAAHLRLKKSNSPETRAKIGAANRGKIRSAEFKAKVSAGMKGIVFSESHKANLAKAAQERALQKRIDRLREKPRVQAILKRDTR